MFVILFYVYIFPFCGDGPLWFQKAKGVGIENCKNYWWTNLLYINNFYPTNMYNEVSSLFLFQCIMLSSLFLLVFMYFNAVAVSLM